MCWSLNNLYFRYPVQGIKLKGHFIAAASKDQKVSLWSVYNDIWILQVRPKIWSKLRSTFGTRNTWHGSENDNSKDPNTRLAQYLNGPKLSSWETVWYSNIVHSKTRLKKRNTSLEFKLLGDKCPKSDFEWGHLLLWQPFKD